MQEFAVINKYTQQLEPVYAARPETNIMGGTTTWLLFYRQDMWVWENAEDYKPAPF